MSNASGPHGKPSTVFAAAVPNTAPGQSERTAPSPALPGGGRRHPRRREATFPAAGVDIPGGGRGRPAAPAPVPRREAARRLCIHTGALLPNFSTCYLAAEVKNYVCCSVSAAEQNRTQQVNIFAENTHAVRFWRYISCRIYSRCCLCSRRRNKIKAMWRFTNTDYCAGEVPAETKISFFYSCSHLHVFEYCIALSTTVHMANPCSANAFPSFSYPHCHCPTPLCSFLLIQHP